MAFVFELHLGDDRVKRVVFAAPRGRRALTTSMGAQVGEIIYTPNGLTLKLDDDAACEIMDGYSVD